MKTGLLVVPKHSVRQGPAMRLVQRPRPQWRRPCVSAAFRLPKLDWGPWSLQG